MSEKNRAAGILMMTESPNYGLVAVLQKRGEFNHEKMAPETWPGGLQLTAWGKLKADEEDFFLGALRECEEELGKETADRVMDRVTFFLRNPEDPEKPPDLENVQELYRFEDAKSLSVAFVVKLPYGFLRTIHLSASSGGLHLLKEEEIEKIQDLKSFDRVTGVTDTGVLAMFADNKEAVKRAFALAKR